MAELLRFATAGSVDDGKSSLIGRLLYDSKSIFEDQFAAIERASRQRGAEQVELALLTDGLRAEREQNITIDVAYRYFSTPKRKFIIADTPGHVQYTRNMVTGVSTVDLSIVLVDASKGMLPQSKRHSAVSALLGVPHLVVAVNKMDLVGFDQARFEEISAEFREIAARLGVTDLTFIPVSALLGDNVVERSERTTWYTGPTLLEHLETVEIPVPEAGADFRLAVQHVIRTGELDRWLAGRVASGSVTVGDRLVVLPSGVESVVAAIMGPSGPRNRAETGDAISIQLADDVDASRGNLLSHPGTRPTAAQEIEAVICWLGGFALEPGRRYFMRHTTARVSAFVTQVRDKFQIETLTPEPAERLEANDIGHVVLHTAEPIFADRYRENREIGSFVLIDPGTYVTVGAGMILDFQTRTEGTRGGFAIEWITEPDADRRRQRAREAEARLKGRGDVIILEESVLAEGLNADGPPLEERLRRIRAVAALLAPTASVVVAVSEGEA